MSEKPVFRRKNYFIKKKFQIDFSIKFLALIILEAVLAIGLFIYLSRGTLTTGYFGSDLKIARTSEFFLPILLLSNLIVLGLTGLAGIVVLILMSHRIAGPLYRFEKVLADISNGDLTRRFRLRGKDQLAQIAESITGFTAVADSKMGYIKSSVLEISILLSEIQSSISSNPPTDKGLEQKLQEVSEKLIELKEAIDYFKTSS